MKELKVDIRHGSAILYRDCDAEPLKVRTLVQHYGNHAEMVASIMADKIEIEVEEELKMEQRLQQSTNNT